MKTLSIQHGNAPRRMQNRLPHGCSSEEAVTSEDLSGTAGSPDHEIMKNRQEASVLLTIQLESKEFALPFWKR